MAHSEIHPTSFEMNLAPLRTLTGGDDHFMIEVLEMLQEQTPITLKQMEQQLANEDFMVLSATAHKFKSSVNFLGNAYMLMLIKNIEVSAQEAKQSAGLVPLVEEFQVICTQMLGRIEEELAQLKHRAAA